MFFNTNSSLSALVYSFCNSVMLIYISKKPKNPKVDKRLTIRQKSKDEDRGKINPNCKETRPKIRDLVCLLI